MYTNILTAVDGSDTANSALTEAIALARIHRSRLRIVHVVDVLSVYSGESPFVDIGNLEQSLTASGRKLLDQALATARQAEVPAEAKLLKIGTLGQRIANLVVEEAKNWPADLIVVGTHGRRGLSRLFLGSQAEGIVRTSPVPVLLIHGT